MRYSDSHALVRVALVLACVAHCCWLTHAQITIAPVSALIDPNAQTVNYPPYRDAVTCACDVTSFVCDALCCCDTSCAQALVSQWQELNVCAKQTNKLYTFLNFPNCSQYVSNPQDKSIYVNQINPISCLVGQNVPYEGDFYTESTVKAEPVTGALKPGQSFYSSLFQQVQAAPTTTPGYAPNSPIVQQRQITGQQAQYEYVNFTVPQADFNGYCGNRRPIVLQQNVRVQCTQRFVRTVSGCSNAAFNADLTLRLSQLVGDTSLPETRPPITYEQLNVDTPNTNAFASTADACDEVLDFVRLDFIVDDKNKISSVRVTYAYADADTTDVTVGQYATVPTQIYVTFTQSTSPSASDSAPTSAKDLEIPYSGSPGYAFGYPLLVGNSFNQVDGASELPVVQRPIDGYQIIVTDSATQECLAAQSFDTPFPVQDSSRVVHFGEDFQVACTVRLSQNDYNSACTSDNSIDNDYQIYQYFTPEQTLVGRYGNANYLNVQDWVPVTDGAQFQNTTGQTCANSHAQKIVTVFYSQAGAVGNLQNYVVRVEYSYPTNRVWVWNAPEGTDAMDFQLTLQVVFVRVPYEELHPSLSSPNSSIENWIKEFLIVFNQNRDKNSRQRRGTSESTKMATSPSSTLQENVPY